MTAPTREIRVTHLFAAEALDTSRWWISRVALCSKEVRGLSTPAGDPEDPDLTTTYRYCPDCVAEAEAAYLASDEGSAFVLHVFIREIKPDLGNDGRQHVDPTSAELDAVVV